MSDTDSHHLTRRKLGKLGIAAFLVGPAAQWPSLSLASNPVETKLHGLSAFGELKPPGFASLDYVKPDAPKGGTFNFSVPYWAFNQNPQTFDTLNSFVLKGSAPPRMEMCFDSLMYRDWNDPSAIYGQLAETVSISADRNTYRFELRKEARFHDNSALTAEDVAFTYNILKKDGHPQISVALGDFTEATAIDASTVELRFNGNQSDRAILTVVLFPILSKAFYTKHTFADSTLEPPLASGPYRVGRVNAGTFIEYDRVDDYWGRDLPHALGQNNFDTIRIEFYRERTAAFEAFKKGDVTWRQEFTSKTWATEYNFPAVEEGRVRRHEFASDQIPSLQAWAVNTRRRKFADPKTREAIGHCFDFEWTNSNFFFNAYQRGGSFFQNSRFAASGTPSAAELELLEPFRNQLDPTVFGTALEPPVSNGTGRDRSMLRKALKLFREAGFELTDGKLVDGDGEQFSIEFLIRSPTFERILGRFVANLKTLGVNASIRLVDPSQFQKRLEEFDFDIAGRALSLTAVPTHDFLQQLFGSSFADRPGSFNLPGMKSDVADALVKRAAEASNLEELTVTLQALDRVLRSQHGWIPNWYAATKRVAWWDMFEFPEAKPIYYFPVEQLWWYSAERAKAIGRA